MEEETKKSPKKISKFVPYVIAGILILAGIGGTYYFYSQNQKSQALLKDPTAAQTAENKATLSKISQFMVLPVDEEPTIATVLDATKLVDQPFFKDAQNDDRVIIYTKANKAILFRPGTGKIINVSTISLGETSTINIAVYNGTKTAGLTTKFADELTKSASNVTVTSKTNAVRNNYQQNLVIDLTGQNAALAKQMADLIGGIVSGLPEGEVKPSGSNVNLLIILGTDFVNQISSPAPEATASPTL